MVPDTDGARAQEHERQLRQRIVIFVNEICRRSRERDASSASGFVEPKVDDLGVVASRERIGAPDPEGRGKVDGIAEHECVLLGERRQTPQDTVRDRGRHLPDLRQVVRVLDAMHDEVGTLRKYRLRQLAWPLRRDDQKQPILATFLGDPLKDPTGIERVLRRRGRYLAMRLLQQQMDGKTAAGIGPPQQSEDHARRDGADQLDDFVLNGVHIDNDDLSRLHVPPLHGAQT